MRVESDDKIIRKPVRLHKNLCQLLVDSAEQRNMKVATLLNSIVEQESEVLVSDISLWPSESESYYPSHGRTVEISKNPISLRMSVRTNENVQKISSAIGFKPLNVIETLIYLHFHKD